MVPQEPGVMGQMETSWMALDGTLHQGGQQFMMQPGQQQFMHPGQMQGQQLMPQQMQGQHFIPQQQQFMNQSVAPNHQFIPHGQIQGQYMPMQQGQFIPQQGQHFIPQQQQQFMPQGQIQAVQQQQYTPPPQQPLQQQKGKGYVRAGTMNASTPPFVPGGNGKRGDFGGDRFGKGSDTRTSFGKGGAQFVDNTRQQKGGKGQKVQQGDGLFSFARRSSKSFDKGDKMGGKGQDFKGEKGQEFKGGNIWKGGYQQQKGDKGQKGNGKGKKGGKQNAPQSRKSTDDDAWAEIGRARQKAPHSRGSG